MSVTIPQKDNQSLNKAGMGNTVRIAGVDEAGRGPLSGPVVAAAVILDPTRPITGLGDSKALSERRRRELFPLIRANAWVGIGIAEPAEIDRLNILHATMAAMRRAVARLPVRPTLVLVDGNRLPPGLPCPAEAIIKGDAKEACIGAASIIAKTVRDDLMEQAARRFPAMVSRATRVIRALHTRLRWRRPAPAPSTAGPMHRSAPRSNPGFPQMRIAVDNLKQG